MFKKILYKILFVIFLSVFVFCSYQLIHRYIESRQQTEQAAELNEITNQVLEKTNEELVESDFDLVTLEKLEEDQNRKKIFLSQQYLKEENDDYVGWLSIPGTIIDYPVVQDRDNPEYYLNRNFNKEKSSYGSIYLDSACMINSSRNYVIYGHHMRDGSMFASLNNYESESYYLEHPTIRFDSLSEIGDYQIIAAFKAPASDLQHLSSIILCENSEQYEQFITYIKENSFYDTGITCIFGEKMLTLMTCEYSYKNGRIFIVAKKTQKEA